MTPSDTTAFVSTPWTAQRLAPVLFLLVLSLAFALANSNFATFANLQNIVLASSILLIIASGSTFVILLGCIDLSVGAIVSLTGIATALLVPGLGVWAVVVSVAVGLAVGIVNGALHVGLRIPSFLVTLGTMTAVGGVSLFLNDGRPIPIVHPTFKFLVSGTLIPGIPNIGLWAAAVYLGLVLVDQRTLFGRHTIAIGGSERTAGLIGLPVGLRKIEAFAISGAAAGLAGALLTARLQTAAIAMGEGLNLQAVATIVIGGTFITGGVGGVARTLIGVLVVVVLSNGLDLLAVHPYVQTIIKGAMVLAAVMAMNDRRLGIPK